MIINNDRETSAQPRAPEEHVNDSHEALPKNLHPPKAFRKQIIIACIIIFLATFCTRLLYWHSERLDAIKVESMAGLGYKDIARHLVRDGIFSFFSPSSPLSSPNTISYQPGYSLLMAVLFRLFGESNTALQLFQIIFDAAAAVMVFLIAAELLPFAVAVISGTLVALCPQFSWFSIILMPDSMGVLPLLLAIFFLIRAYKRPRLITFMVAGAFIGLSCWLRANGLLLAPFLAAVTIPLLFERGKRLRYAAALLGGTIIIIAPVTIRNAVVHGHFIPLSLRAGNTLVEGIADYDTEGRFGLQKTDMSLMKWEAEAYNRPDYYGNLFEPDGIKRERMRIRRGLAVIRDNPIWFAGVMIRRAAKMFRLSRVNLLKAEPPVTHSLAIAEETPPAWESTPADMLTNGVVRSSRAKMSLTPDNQALYVTGDDSNYGEQVASAPVPIHKNQDYLLRLPIKIEQGRMTVNVINEERNVSYASAVVELAEEKTPQEQPTTIIQLPFVSTDDGQVRVVLRNEASNSPSSVVQVGAIKLFALGPASYLWTQYLRAPLRLVQRVYLTAIMLPLAILGMALLVRARRWHFLVLLLSVPAYYICVQSALITEYRYVLAFHYFLFIMAAIALHWLGDMLWQVSRKVITRQYDSG
jgi:hypothetical protein